MDCRKVVELVDSYFENRLTDIENVRIKKHINECSECNKVYDEMGEIFNLLEEHSHFQIVKPSEDFNDKVMVNIKREKKVLNFKKLDLRRLGTSLVAAGILIALINFEIVNYNLEEVAGDVYKNSIEINRRIYDPITKISQLFKKVKMNNK